MPIPFESPVLDEDGDERHPAFAIARVGRIQSNPGEVLFQSDLRHREYIEVTVSEAARHRDLKHDWVYPGRVVCKFSMSLAQFASFVSSGGTEGVPVTLEYANGETKPRLPYLPRLSVSRDEAHNAAQEAFSGIQEKLNAYEAILNSKAPAAERRKALSTLRATVTNATANVDLAAKAFAEHAEEVVEKSRSDIEAMVTGMAAQLGVSPEQLADSGLLAIAVPDSEEASDAES